MLGLNNSAANDDVEKKVLYMEPELLRLLEHARNAGMMPESVRRLPFQHLQKLADYLIDFGEAHTDNSVDHNLWKTIRDAQAEQLKAKGSDIRKFGMESGGDVQQYNLAQEITRNVRAQLKHAEGLGDQYLLN